MSEQTTVVMKGYGPNVRIKATGPVNDIKVLTSKSVRTVPLGKKGVNLTFHQAA